jgi:hypothetical protein
VSRIVAIGEDMRLAGYAMAGVHVLAAEDPGAVTSAWEGMAPDVACLLLTPAAHAVIEPRLGERPELVWTVVAR